MFLQTENRVLKVNQETSYDLNNLVIVVSPHQDDESIGCGGAVAFLISSKYNVHFIFTTIESSSRARLRKLEAQKAIKALGGSIENIHFLDLPDGDSKKFILNYSKSVGIVSSKIKEIELKQSVIEIGENNKEILLNNKHTLILTTSRHDAHRDHEETFNMIKNGTRKKIIMEFPVVNHMSSAFIPNCFIEIPKEIYEIKKRALSKYFGEDIKGRIMWADIEALMLENGKKCNSELAESCFVSWYGYLKPINLI